MRFVLGLSRIRIAIASVLAFLTLLSLVFSVSDRLGGPPIGYIYSGVLTILVFVLALVISRGLASKPVESKPALPPSEMHLIGSTIVPSPFEIRARVNESSSMIVTEREESIVAPIETPIVRESNPASKPTDAIDETVFDDVVKAKPGREGCWDHELSLDVGDTLEGDLREMTGQAFNWMIVSRRNRAAFLNGDDDVEYAIGEEYVRVANFDWKMRKGRWYLVIDAIQKQYDRDIHVHLRRVHRPAKND